MEGKTYYQILGVSSTASLAEITAAKNRLAKEYHPDVNMRKGIDTTALMQEVLEAYQILSDETTRADYDRRIAGRSAVMQTFDLHEAAENEAQEDPAFVTYWKASNDLYDIVTESDALFRQTTTSTTSSLRATPSFVRKTRPAASPSWPCRPSGTS